MIKTENLTINGRQYVETDEPIEKEESIEEAAESELI